MRRAKGCRARAREQEHELRNSVHHGNGGRPTNCRNLFFSSLGVFASSQKTRHRAQRAEAWRAWGLKPVPGTCPSLSNLLLRMHAGARHLGAQVVFRLHGLPA